MKVYHIPGLGPGRPGVTILAPMDETPPKGPDAPAQDNPVILFDGVCNLCNGTVDFILRRDPAGRFRFAALQSETGRRLATRAGADPDRLETLLLIRDGRVHRRSGAVLRIAASLGLPWSLFAAFLAIPWFLRDWAYMAIAAIRYPVFGKRPTCRLPTPEEQERFLK